jgi:hypothetical protein
VKDAITPSMRKTMFLCAKINMKPPNEVWKAHHAKECAPILQQWHYYLNQSHKFELSKGQIREKCKANDNYAQNHVSLCTNQ